MPEGIHCATVPITATCALDCIKYSYAFRITSVTWFFMIWDHKAFISKLVFVRCWNPFHCLTVWSIPNHLSLFIKPEMNSRKGIIRVHAIKKCVLSGLFLFSGLESYLWEGLLPLPSHHQQMLLPTQRCCYPPCRLLGLGIYSLSTFVLVYLFFFYLFIHLKTSPLHIYWPSLYPLSLYPHDCIRSIYP